MLPLTQWSGIFSLYLINVLRLLSAFCLTQFHINKIGADLDKFYHEFPERVFEEWLKDLFLLNRR